MTFLPNREFLIEVAKGAVSGHTLVTRTSYLANLTTSLKDVWVNDATFNWQSSAQSVEAVSSDADDVASTGTGARTIKVWGLSSTFVEQNETISMNGTTAVALSNTYRFIDRAEVLTAGSSETNEGNIDLRIASAGAILARIGTDAGQTGLSQYVVPAAKTAYILGWQITILNDTVGVVDANLAICNDAAAWRKIARLQVRSGATSAQLGLDHGVVTPLAEKTRVRLQAKSDTSGVGIASTMTLLVVG